MTAIDRYSDGRYLAHNPTWGEEESPWKANLVMEMIARHHLQPQRIIEIGCGSGRMLECLHDALPTTTELTGYEISPQAFDRCRSKEGDRLHYVNGGLSRVPRDAAYDLALAMDVFEHVEDLFAFLRALRSLGRYQVLHIPLDISVQTVLRGHPLDLRRRTLGHIHFFTKDTALATLEDCGYAIIEATYTSKPMNLRPKARLARQLRKLPFAIHQDLAVRILGGYSLLVLAG